MTLPELTSLDPVTLVFLKRGWRMIQTSWRDVDSSSATYALKVQSPRLNAPFLVSTLFDQETIERLESEAVARQNHGGEIDSVLYNLRADLIRQLGAIYRVSHKGAAIPSEVVVKELVFSFKQPVAQVPPTSP